MEKQKYIVVNALIYEVILFLQEFSAFFKTNPWIKQILKNCFEDWCAYRAEREMIEVDKQVQKLHELWDEEEKDYIEPLYSELPPDDSIAQSLLGGEIRLTAPFYSPTEASKQDS